MKKTLLILSCLFPSSGVFASDIIEKIDNSPKMQEKISSFVSDVWNEIIAGPCHIDVKSVSWSGQPFLYEYIYPDRICFKIEGNLDCELRADNNAILHPCCDVRYYEDFDRVYFEDCKMIVPAYPWPDGKTDDISVTLKSVVVIKVTE